MSFSVRCFSYCIDFMNEELSFDTTFLFYPSEIRPLADGRNIAISTQSANWIILNDDVEKDVFLKLYSGKSIGEVIEGYGASDEDVMAATQKVLAKIGARNFAGISALPTLSRVEGFKMMNLYVTNACNLRCPHCFMNAGTPLKNELTNDEIKRILAEFRSNNGEYVTFTGGEPMLRKGFIGILRYSKGIGLSNTVLSNGILWTISDIEEAYKYIDEIQISIDGVDDDTNSKIRGIGNFDMAVRTAKEFAKKGVKLSIATTFAQEDLGRELVPRYLSLKSEIEALSPGNVSFKFSKKILPGRGIAPTEDENIEYMAKISSIESAVKPDAKIENFIMGHESNSISRNCGIGGISVRADGHIFFCNRIHEVDDYGHVFSRDMHEWFKIGKEINELTSVDNVEPCSSCVLKNICNGGCRIDDYSNKGRTKDIDAPWIQVSCSEEKKAAIISKMVQAFDEYYDFSQ